jgi:hypothetical protein
VEALRKASYKPLLRGFFILLLLASAVGKLLDMPGFYAVVESYQALPKAIVPAAAWALAFVELGFGLWLWRSSPQRRFAPSLAVLALHLMYMAWLVVAFARGLNIPNCGCFGVFFARPLTAQTLIEDSLLIVLAAALVWSARDTNRLQATSVAS